MRAAIWRSLITAGHAAEFQHELAASRFPVEVTSWSCGWCRKARTETQVTFFS